MKTVFSYIVFGGILIGAVAASAAAQSGPASQGQKKERAQVVIVEKKDHGKNGSGGASTTARKQ